MTGFASCKPRLFLFNESNSGAHFKIESFRARITPGCVALATKKIILQFTC